MANGIIVRLTHLQKALPTPPFPAGSTVDESILITDLTQNRAGGVESPVYVTVGTPVDLVYTDKVARSFEDGAIRQFVTSGDISADLIVQGDSFANTRSVQIQVTNPNGADVATGDNQAVWYVPEQYDGWTVSDVVGAVTTVSSAGDLTIQVRDSAAGDILSTPLTIDQSEFDSSTAAAPVVINTALNTLSEGDQLRIDIDGAGTGAKGLLVVLVLTAPTS